MEDEDAPRLQICPDCESTELVKLGLVQPQQVSLDLKGVLRVDRNRRDVDREMREAILFHPKLPRTKVDNYFPRVQTRWKKEGRTNFAERHDELWKAVEWFETKCLDFNAASFRGN